MPPLLISNKRLQVYSLTGRDLPRTVREKLKSGGYAVPNPRNNPHHYQQSSRPHVRTIFEDGNMEQKRPDSGLGSSGELSPRINVAGSVSTVNKDSDGSSKKVIDSKSGSATVTMSSQHAPKSKYESNNSNVVSNKSVSTSVVINSNGSQQPLAVSKTVSNNSMPGHHSGTKIFLKKTQPITSNVTNKEAKKTIKETVTSQKVHSNEAVKEKVPASVNRSTSDEPIKTRTALSGQGANVPIKSSGTVNRSISDPSRSQGNIKAKLGPPPKREKNSAIMARAAFWDKRIDEGEADDDKMLTEFPEMPEDSFKRYT